MTDYEPDPIKREINTAFYVLGLDLPASNIYMRLHAELGARIRLLCARAYEQGVDASNRNFSTNWHRPPNPYEEI